METFLRQAGRGISFLPSPLLSIILFPEFILDLILTLTCFGDILVETRGIVPIILMMPISKAFWHSLSLGLVTVEMETGEGVTVAWGLGVLSGALGWLQQWACDNSWHGVAGRPGSAQWAVAAVGGWAFWETPGDAHLPGSLTCVCDVLSPPHYPSLLWSKWEFN